MITTRDNKDMVSFHKKARSYALFEATQEEWDTLKDLMNRVAHPVEGDNVAELYVMSGFEDNDFKKWLQEYQDYSEAPPFMHKNHLRYIFSVANNAEDAKVIGLSDAHWKIINDIQKYDLGGLVHFEVF